MRLQALYRSERHGRATMCKMKKFLLFVMLAYGPFVLVWMAFAQGMVVHLMIPGGGSTLLRAFAPFLVLPWLVILVVYRKLQHSSQRIPAAATLYLGWLGLGAIASYIVLAAVGGTSMAVADGGAAGMVSRQAALKIPQTLALLHIGILPWLYVSLQLLRKTKLVS